MDFECRRHKKNFHLGRKHSTFIDFEVLVVTVKLLKVQYRKILECGKNARLIVLNLSKIHRSVKNVHLDRECYLFDNRKIKEHQKAGSILVHNAFLRRREGACNDCFPS